MSDNRKYIPKFEEDIDTDRHRSHKGLWIVLICLIIVGVILLLLHQIDKSIEERELTDNMVHIESIR